MSDKALQVRFVRSHASPLKMTVSQNAATRLRGYDVTAWVAHLARQKTQFGQHRIELGQQNGEHWF